jgi:cell division protein FtsI/penicillin-binding protein 2
MTRREFLAASATLVVPAGGDVQWMAGDDKGKILRSHWQFSERAVSVGSLLKPFLALAYARTHQLFPTIECGGARDGCWYAPGHGLQPIVAALANSCNVYFLHLGAAMDRAALDFICLSYGLNSPERTMPSSRIMGLSAGWPQRPAAVVNAFAALLRDGVAPGARDVFEGMTRCSEVGTARGMGFRCYAKTGTAVCSHGGAGLTDGFAVAMYPLDQPRRVLLVTRHNTTGAHAAQDTRRVAREVV